MRKRKSVYMIIAFIILSGLILFVWNVIFDNNTESFDEINTANAKKLEILEKISWNDVENSFFTSIKKPQEHIAGLNHMGFFKNADEDAPFTFLEQIFEGDNLSFVNTFIQKNDGNGLSDTLDVKNSKLSEIKGVPVYINSTESEPSQKNKSITHSIEWVKNDCRYRVLANNVKLDDVIKYVEGFI